MLTNERRVLPGVVGPVVEHIFEHGVHPRLDPGQGGSLELIQRRHVMRAAAVGEVVEMLDEHPDNLEGVSLGEGEVSHRHPGPRAARLAGELSQPRRGEDGQQTLRPPHLDKY